MKINTFLIGVQKAGTSTFWNWLSQHPEIYAPEVMKDYHFFSRAEFRKKGVEDLHRYYNGFDGEKIVMHGGVNYYFEVEFLEHVLDYQTHGKYILILRDPVERAWSAYQYFKKLGQEKRSFENAIQDELQNKILPEYRHRYAYLEHGLYAKYLNLIISHISTNQIKIVEYRELFDNPDKKMRDVFNFLGVSLEGHVDYTIRKNTFGEARYPWLNEMLFSDKRLLGCLKRNFPVQKLLPLSWRIHIGNTMREVNVKPNSAKDQMTDELKKYLTDFYFDDQIELVRLLVEKWGIEPHNRCI